ncbi:MAG: 30S ribosomal protein S20 [Patescibacteria group bacterium]
MPVTKSAKKALKTDIRRKLENDLVRSKIKGALKGAKISIAKKESDVAEKIQSLYHELDLAAKKNVIHRNKAARLKSRIAKSASKAETTVAEVKPKKVKKAAK